jgi:hypothetical protein
MIGRFRIPVIVFGPSPIDQPAEIPAIEDRSLVVIGKAIPARPQEYRRGITLLCSATFFNYIRRKAAFNICDF